MIGHYVFIRFPFCALVGISKMQVILNNKKSELEFYLLSRGFKSGAALTTTLIKESNCPQDRSIHIRLFD